MANVRLGDGDGFAGMRMNQSVPHQSGIAYYIQNLRPMFNGRQPGPLVCRPGFAFLGDTNAASGNATNCVGELLKKDGSSHFFVVEGGVIYTLGASGWAVVVTSANLGTAGINRSSNTTPWHWVQFNDKIVFSDGINDPFTWDGTTGAGGLVQLTNADVAFGWPVVHAGRLWLIKNTERNTFIWSEVNDETTGYESGGYNNAWTFAQAGAEPITRLLGSNHGLFVVRPTGVGLLVGKTSASFQTTATDDAVSTEIGSRSRHGALLQGSFLYCVDALGRPQALPVFGGQPVPLWEDLYDLYLWGGQGDSTAVRPPFDIDIELREHVLSGGEHWVTYRPLTNEVIFWFDDGTGQYRWGAAYDAVTMRCVEIVRIGGVSETLAAKCFGRVTEAYGASSSRPKAAGDDLIIGAELSTSTWVLGLSRASPNEDRSSFMSPDPYVITAAYGRGDHAFDFHDITLACTLVDDQLAPNDLDYTVEYFTPERFTGSLNDAAVSRAATYAEASGGTEQDHSDSTLTWGIDAHGRWCRVRASLNEQYTGVTMAMIHNITVSATDLGMMGPDER